MELEKDELQDDIIPDNPEPEPEPENPEDTYLKECLKEFLSFYPEFNRLFVKVELVEKEPENDNDNKDDSESGDLENKDNLGNEDLGDTENNGEVLEVLNALNDLPNEPDDINKDEPNEKPKPDFIEVELVNEIMVKNWESVFRRVVCLYPEFKDAKNCQKVPLYALIAHYFVYQGFASSIGILSQKGLVASSSVGDVSVSYQASPYASKGNDFSYFLSLTPYGMEYLAWLQRQAGLLYVN